MSGFQGFRNLKGEFQGLFNRNRTALQLVGECIAFDEFQNEEPSALVFFKPVDCGDVGMIQRSEKFSFTFKACKAVRILSKLFRKGFDGDFTT